MSGTIRTDEVHVFIQRPSDELFLKDKKEWVSEKSNARSFETAVDALVFCISEHLGNVKLVVTRRDQPDNVLHPFREERNPPSGPAHVRKVVRSRYRQMRRERD